MSYMTKLPGIPDKDEIRPGMASWYGGGPKGKTCGTCVHRGYWKDNGKKTMGCAEFHRMSGRHGPAVNSYWSACKHYQSNEPEKVK